MFTCTFTGQGGWGQKSRGLGPLWLKAPRALHGNFVSQLTTLHVPVKTVPFYIYQSFPWIHMINPWITGSKCVGKKVRHLTTTLPQQVAADISNFLTALESFLWTALSNLLLTLSDRLPSSRQNGKSVPVSLLKRNSENMKSEHEHRFGGK